MKAKAKCKKCGGEAIADVSQVLTSIPHKFKGKCKSCGEIDYYETHEVTFIYEPNELNNGLNYIGNPNLGGTGSNYYKECNHMIDVKYTSNGYVTYCLKCGKIFDTKQCSFNGQFTCSSN